MEPDMNDLTPTRLRIIATGGTFDKLYDPATGTLGFGSRSALPTMIEQARLESSPVIDLLMRIDSLDMTNDDRHRILATCQASPEKAIVIVHGTDTLVETAQVLAHARIDACIVLTGAMVPACIDGSDARFNLGFAAACAQLLPVGVHIAAHGRVFAWNAVRKNRSGARFESL